MVECEITKGITSNRAKRTEFTKAALNRWDKITLTMKFVISSGQSEQSKGSLTSA